MSRTIDYYIGPLSPWSYLGHERFTAMAKDAGATVHLRPFDMNAVFAVSGGLPLGQRPAQRQAYRLLELARFSKDLGMPMNLHPKFFPVAPDPAAKLITAVALHDGPDAAMRICGAVFSAVWERELDISNAAVLAQLVRECDLAAERTEQATSDEVKALYEDNTRQAMAAQIFGAPSYIIDGELFWGQDRLHFVQKALVASGVD
ncbi:MAG: 2-hydroxychromene-2-carboxylate isomerase [Rhizobacter sp.]|nr:2-hydroxychromene-2-carboxylate isomerase [Rhizobacter sp.]